VGSTGNGNTANGNGNTAPTLAQLQLQQLQQLQQQQQQQQQAALNNTCFDVSTTTSNIKTELAEYLMTSDIDDIAALIGSAIAEQQPSLEQVSSSTVDPWTELDAWIRNACSQETALGGVGVGVGVLDGDNTSAVTSSVLPGANDAFALPSVVSDYSSSAFNGNGNSNNGNNNGNNNTSPILQARLQSSPQMPESTSNYPHIKVEPCYNLVEPHVSPTVTSTSARFKKSSLNRGEQKLKKRKKSPPSIDLGSDKEKPIHRCGICNRGFLNKSNIKVHLRTHTGEKPFKCDTCGKAFRQKAHLLKHVQIHKRIPRD
jgi:uncharacterized Zn-finger protein